MLHVFVVVASAVGLIGGILGFIVFLDSRRKRSFQDFVNRKHTDKTRLSGRFTDQVNVNKVPSRLADYARKRGVKKDDKEDL